MQPSTVNKIGMTATFLVRVVLSGLAIWFATDSRYFATAITLIIAASLKWDNDGKFIKDGTE